MYPSVPNIILPARIFTVLVFMPLALMPCLLRAENDSAHAQASKKTAPYYQDAQLCRSRSKLDPLPEGADPAITIDSARFLQCINQMGYHQEAKTDPLLVALHRCRNQKSRAVSASGEVIHHAPSQAQVRSCLATRGFPSAGTPPNPNAPVAGNVDHHSTSPVQPKPSDPTPASHPRVQSPDDGQIQTVIIPPRKKLSD